LNKPTERNTRGTRSTRNIVRISLWCCLCFLCSLPAYAQSHEVWVSGGKSLFGFPYFHTNRALGSTDPSGARNDLQIDNGWRVGFRLGFNTSGLFGHEFQYAYNRPIFVDNSGAVLGAVGRDRMEIHQAGYNFLYYFASPETAFRPLVTVGVHLNDFVLPGAASAPQASSAKFGLNYGVGFKMRLSPLFGIRGDVRGYETGKPNWGGFLVNQSGLLHQAEVSGGLGIYF
jgi:opacity protein-like surface antigen